MIINWDLFLESIDYNKYTQELTEKEFFDMYEQNCDEYDFDNPFLIRMIEKDSDYLYVNTTNHVTYGKDTPHHKLYFKLTETKTWKGYPSKIKSLDFAHINYNIYNYGTEYYLIPFNGARFATCHNLFTQEIEYASKKLLPENTIMPATYLLKPVTNIYKEITKVEFKPEDLNIFFDVLDKYLKTREIQNNNVFEHIVFKIKEEMLLTNKNFGDTLMDIFDPKKNNIKLHNLESLKKSRYKESYINEPTNYVGWTDSKVLMINKKLYDKKYNK